jgi:hypothetical protein
MQTGWNETLTRFTPRHTLSVVVERLDFGYLILANGYRACGATLREALNALIASEGGPTGLVIARTLCRSAIEALNEVECAADSTVPAVVA